MRVYVIEHYPPDRVLEVVQRNFGLLRFPDNTPDLPLRNALINNGLVIVPGRIQRLRLFPDNMHGLIFPSMEAKPVNVKA